MHANSKPFFKKCLFPNSTILFKLQQFFFLFFYLNFEKLKNFLQRILYLNFKTFRNLLNIYIVGKYILAYEFCTFLHTPVKFIVEDYWEKNN